jgi:hypothetical protein
MSLFRQSAHRGRGCGASAFQRRFSFEAKNSAEKAAKSAIAGCWLWSIPFVILVSVQFAHGFSSTLKTRSAS